MNLETIVKFAVLSEIKLAVLWIEAEASIVHVGASANIEIVSRIDIQI